MEVWSNDYGEPAIVRSSSTTFTASYWAEQRWVCWGGEVVGE